MFNGHLSLSHPPPVHHSEEMGLRNPLIRYRMNLDCFFYCHWCSTCSDLARLSAVDKLTTLLLVSSKGKFYTQTTYTHIVYSTSDNKL